MISYDYRLVSEPRLRAVVPGLESMTLWQRALAIRQKLWRFLFTGVNDPPLDGWQEGNALEILKWWQANLSANHGLGPCWSCGTLANFYLGICAAWGVYGRKVMAIGAQADSPDHEVEIWDGAKWVWMDIGANCHITVLQSLLSGGPIAGRPLSYHVWSSLEQEFGRAGSLGVVSPTGGFCCNPNLDAYSGWVGFWRHAVHVNGNGTLFDTPETYKPPVFVQIWGDGSKLCPPGFSPVVAPQDEFDLPPPGEHPLLPGAT